MKRLYYLFPALLLGLVVAGCTTTPSLGMYQSATVAPAITLEEAVNIVSREQPCGVIKEVELEFEGGRSFYEVELMRTDGTKEMLIVDAGSGRLLADASEATNGLARMNGECPPGVNGTVERVEVPTAPVNPCNNRSVNLINAIRVAETAVGGKAVDIEAKGCNFEVHVVTADNMWQLKVAPDGSILDRKESEKIDD